jgi:hypothetical protein
MKGLMFGSKSLKQKGSDYNLIIKINKAPIVLATHQQTDHGKGRLQPDLREVSTIQSIFMDWRLV